MTPQYLCVLSSQICVHRTHKMRSDSCKMGITKLNRRCCVQPHHFEITSPAASLCEVTLQQMRKNTSLAIRTQVRDMLVTFCHPTIYDLGCRPQALCPVCGWGVQFAASWPWRSYSGAGQPGCSPQSCWDPSWLQGRLQMLGITLQAAHAYQSFAFSELVQFLNFMDIYKSTSPLCPSGDIHEENLPSASLHQTVSFRTEQIASPKAPTLEFIVAIKQKKYSRFREGPFELINQMTQTRK